MLRYKICFEVKSSRDSKWYPVQRESSNLKDIQDQYDNLIVMKDIKNISVYVANEPEWEILQGVTIICQK